MTGGMDGTTIFEQRDAEALVGALEQMLAELAAVTVGDDVGWVRPSRS